MSYLEELLPEFRKDEVTFYEDKKDEIWTSYASYERGEDG